MNESRCKTSVSCGPDSIGSMISCSTYFTLTTSFRSNPTLGHIFVKATLVHFLMQTGSSSRKRKAAGSAESATTSNARTPVVKPSPKVQNEVMTIDVDICGCKPPCLLTQVACI